MLISALTWHSTVESKLQKEREKEKLDNSCHFPIYSILNFVEAGLRALNRKDKGFFTVYVKFLIPLLYFAHHCIFVPHQLICVIKKGPNTMLVFALMKSYHFSCPSPLHYSFDNHTCVSALFNHSINIMEMSDYCQPLNRHTTLPSVHSLLIIRYRIPAQCTWH